MGTQKRKNTNYRRKSNQTTPYRVLRRGRQDAAHVSFVVLPDKELDVNRLQLHACRDARTCTQIMHVYNDPISTRVSAITLRHQKLE